MPTFHNIARKGPPKPRMKPHTAQNNEIQSAPARPFSKPRNRPGQVRVVPSQLDEQVRSLQQYPRNLFEGIQNVYKILRGLIQKLARIWISQQQRLGQLMKRQMIILKYHALESSFSKQTYRFQIMPGLKNLVIYPTTCLIDMQASRTQSDG